MAADIIDIDFILADGHHNIHHNARLICRDNHDVRLIYIIRGNIPGHIDQAALLLRVVGHDIRTVRPVNGDAAAPGDIADNWISRYWVATPGQFDHDAVLAFHQNTVAGFGLGSPWF